MRVVLFLLIVTLASAILAQSLPDYLTTDNRGTIPALYNGDSVFSDYNGDGRPDLFLCGSDNSGVPTTVIMENHGTYFQVFISPFYSVQSLINFPRV